MENKKPYFHQIVFDDYIARRVRIPPLFMKHLSKDMSDEVKTEATIKNPTGCWPVKLRKTSTCTYIDDGWSKVMEDNGLGNREFLLFRYEGNMCFNLQIFEDTGCERIYPTLASNKRKERSDHLESLHKETNVGERNDTFNNIENPHFQMCLKKRHVQKTFILRLPRKFSERVCRTGERITIQVENSKGEGCEVNASMNNGSYCLCGGWHIFVSANNLKEGDECIFELLSENRIRVHKIIDCMIKAEGC